jgi:hypothetical protein
MMLTSLLASSAAFVLAEEASQTSLPIPADTWSAKYRNWTYSASWIIPPSCIDPVTCGQPPYINRTGAFSDIFQVWSVSNPWATPPPSPRFIGVYTFYDGVGYQTAWSSSDDLVHFSQQLSPEGILYSPRTSWPSRLGDFDYGGAAFVGPLLTDYNVSSPRVLARAPGSDRFWYAYFGQPTRGSLEPPPGASGLASSSDGRTWLRETATPFLDTDPTHGAQPWEMVQVYAPYLVMSPGGTGVCAYRILELMATLCGLNLHLYATPTDPAAELTDFYNARSVAPQTEQSGVATLPGGASSLPGVDPLTNRSAWVRFPANPVIRNGGDTIDDTAMASDPKVYWDATLGGGVGAWVMLYFGVGARGGAAICIAFSWDARAWVKASTPLYEPGGHPGGLDACHAHKAWLTADETGRMYLYYTGDDCKGRGILLLTSSPLP